MVFHAHKPWPSYFFWASYSSVGLLQIQVKGAVLSSCDSKQILKGGTGEESEGEGSDNIDYYKIGTK